MKKTISIVLLLSLLSSMSSVVFAAESTEPTHSFKTNSEKILPIISSAELAIPTEHSELMSEEALRDSYFTSREFQMHYATDPVDALATLNKIVSDYYTPITAMPYTTTDEEVVSVNTTLVQQPNGTYCGPTSSYMAIDGWNGTGDIRGKNTDEKIDQLAKDMYTDSSGSFVYRVRDGLNKYTNNYDYGYTKGTELTQFLFRIYTFNSLAYDRIPLLHAKTGSLSYYNGHNTGHYIAVTEFDYNTMDVRLHDPHNNNAYYGIHYVPYEEAFSSISDYSERYYIYYWPE